MPDGTSGELPVRLRPLARGDAEVVVRWRSQPEVASQLFSASPPTLAQHLAWFERYQQSSDRREWIIEAGPKFSPVGTIGLSGIDRASSRAEYGILLGEAWARGRGVARRASELLLAWAFGEGGLRRVFLQVRADNAEGLRLYERVGFLREGCLRAHTVRDGIAADVVVMGILRDEYARADAGSRAAGTAVSAEHGGAPCGGDPAEVGRGVSSEAASKR